MKRVQNLITTYPVPEPNKKGAGVMNNKLLKNFRDIYRNEKNIQSFSAYYRALCDWVENNRKILGDEVIHRNRLDMLISLDLDKYLIASSEIGLSLELEEKRIGTTNFSRVDGLLSAISDTLWDMVTIRSDTECTNCKCGDLRYIKINYHANSKIALECNECGYAMNVDGSELEEKIIDFLPATKAEVEV